jgi:integrase
MSDSNSTAAAKSAKPAKPAKPYPDYPLTPHPAGQWCKKVRGKMHYFGPWADPDDALARYLAQKDALHAGRTPRPEAGALTIKDLANAFLNAKAASRDAGELAPRSWQDYRDACDLLVRHFGKSRLVEDLGPEDFAGLRQQMAKRWGPRTLGNVIQRLRVAFKFAADNGLIEHPVRYGQGFKRPSKKVLRLHKTAQGVKLFTAPEIRRMLAAAKQPLKAMILLGINCGLGNTDCGRLPLTALDLDSGWLDYPRPKTGIPRRCPLWPETIQALKEVLAGRREATDEAAALVFLTQRGTAWVKGRGAADAALTHEMRKLLDKLGINGSRNFYSLRHTFRTVADDSKDSVACDFIMGHEVPNMSSAYRETISAERLKAVANHVHSWLFPPHAQSSTPPAG